MDDIDLINECYDQSKAIAIRIDTTCLKSDLKINARKTKSMCTTEEPRKWGCLMVMK